MSAPFKIRPLRLVREGVALSRDGNFMLVRSAGSWQASSATPEVGKWLLEGGVPPVCVRRRDLADWLETLRPR